MCKYRASEPKFKINSNDEDVCRSVAEACGIPFHGKKALLMFSGINSETAKGFLRWSMKHKRLALPFTSILDSIVAAGIEPLNETEYTGN
jgi:cysteine sulfinate desulfinase/cysteine desulfurase-like protein